MMMSFGLDERVALVTGSARGLGFEIARALGQAGAVVYVNGTDRERAQLAVERLQSESIRALPLVFDVADEAAGDAVLAEIFAAQGRLDILVNNVGARLRKPLDEISGQDLRNLLDPNVIGPFTLAKRAAQLMTKGNYGRIINIGSVASQRARVNDAAYIIAKGALNSLTIALAAEFGPSGITCNAILPGMFGTETNAEAFKTEMAQSISRIEYCCSVRGRRRKLAAPPCSWLRRRRRM